MSDLELVAKWTAVEYGLVKGKDSEYQRYPHPKTFTERNPKYFYQPPPSSKRGNFQSMRYLTHSPMLCCVRLKEAMGSPASVSTPH